MESDNASEVSNGKFTHSSYSANSLGPAGRVFDIGKRLRGEDIAVASAASFEDDLISHGVREALEHHLDILAQNTTDFHPGSDRKVLDLIHPSLYCYAKGITCLASTGQPEVWIEPVGAAANTTSRYQWLPSEVEVDVNGLARFVSPLHNIDVDANSGLCSVLEECLTKVLPLLEQVSGRGQLKERRLQVIVKAVNYILQPGQEHKGVWHVEGMEHERVISSALIYYSTTANMQGEGLAFRRSVTEEEEEELLYLLEQCEAPYFESECVISLGTVATPAGRCMAFPNTHQHKLCTLSNSSDTVATRKILCFFLVDPESPVLSTRDVRCQNRRRWLSQVLPILAIKSRLPSALLKMILWEFVAEGMTLAQAEEHRLKMMRERKYLKDKMNRDVPRVLNLCEH